MKQPRILFFDLDRTLLNSEGIVSDKTLEALQKAHDSGYLLGLNTGRDVSSVLSLLSEWKLENLIDVIVGTGGAEIYDRNWNRKQSAYPLKGELIQEIIDHYSDLDVNFAIPYEGILYTPKDDRHIQSLSKADHVPYQVVNFDEFLHEPKPKVMIVCNPEQMEDVIQRAKTFSNQQYRSATLKTASILYEYMDPRIGKPFGIQMAIEPFGLTLVDVCAFGDADNDHDGIAQYIQTQLLIH
ncbi:HAD family hydrolase [Dubosiella newyorkensis]|uniref:HAD family hydrolase n=1 Tax=Dubosiella newyorkensis TaxID=1862672 RepID=UPI0032B2DF94